MDVASREDGNEVRRREAISRMWRVEVDLDIVLGLEMGGSLRWLGSVGGPSRPKSIWSKWKREVALRL